MDNSQDYFQLITHQTNSNKQYNHNKIKTIINKINNSRNSKTKLIIKDKINRVKDKANKIKLKIIKIKIEIIIKIIFQKYKPL